MEQVPIEDNTAGVPNSDEGAASESPADTAFPPEIPQVAALELIGALTLANTLLLRTTATTPKKPETSTGSEKGVQLSPGDGTTKEELSVEMQDVVKKSVTHSNDLVANMNGEVVKFLPKDHEHSSARRILRLVMDLALLVCLTGVFAGLLASNVLEGSGVWNLEGWRLC